MRADPALSRFVHSEVIDPQLYVGRAPEQVDEYLAESLRPLLENPAAEWPDPVYCQYPRANTIWGRSVRTARLRFNRWAGSGEQAVEQEELYDFADGELESVNRLNDPAYAEEVKRLRSLLDRRSGGVLRSV